MNNLLSLSYTYCERKHIIVSFSKKWINIYPTVNTPALKNVLHTKQGRQLSGAETLMGDGCLHRMAAQTDMAVLASEMGLFFPCCCLFRLLGCLCVLVHIRRMLSSVGAHPSTIPSQLKECTLWFCSTELYLLEHITLISSWTTLPIFATICFRSCRSLKNWSTIVILLPLTTSLPTFLRLGVRR